MAPPLSEVRSWQPEKTEAESRKPEAGSPSSFPLPASSCQILVILCGLWSVVPAILHGGSATVCGGYGLVWAADVQVQAMVSRRQVPLNGRLELTLQVEGTQNAQAPELSLSEFDAQYVGPSTQISIINGRMSASVAHRYLLTPRREGKATIEPIRIEVEGRTFQTQPIEVEVLPPASVTSQGGTGGGLPAPDEPAPLELGKALQLVVAPERTRAYLNQAIPIRLQLVITGVGVRDIQMPTLQAEGFLVKPLGEPTQSDLVVGGQPATLLEFHTVAVPLKTGWLAFGPASLECRVVQPRPARRRRGVDPFEDFFGGGSLFDEFFGGAQLVPARVRAEPVSLEVLPLPEEGKPATFSGAVGVFTMELTAVPREVAVGEPVTLTMTVRGTGNGESVASPTLSGDLSRWKVYDAQPRAPRQPGPSVTGQTEPADLTDKTFEQVLIPLDPSVREIPQAQFSFFNPENGRYETVTQGPLPIRVTPAPVQTPAPLVTPPMPAPATGEPGVLGRDIVYIKEAPGTLGPSRWRWDRSALWWVLALGPFGLLAASEAVRRRWERLRRDPSLARASGALKRAIAGCQRARQLAASGKVSDGYAELFKALQRYVGDRFALPHDGLTKLEMEQHLSRRGAPEEILRGVGELCDRCDAARFAPQSLASAQADAAIRQAETVLKALERWKPSPSKG